MHIQMDMHINNVIISWIEYCEVPLVIKMQK